MARWHAYSHCSPGLNLDQQAKVYNLRAQQLPTQHVMQHLLSRRTNKHRCCPRGIQAHYLVSLQEACLAHSAQSSQECNGVQHEIRGEWGS